MSDQWMPFIWTGISLTILVLLQRWIHAHLGGIAMLLTGKPQRAVIFYAVVLFPGVLLHEISHWLMATFLGVRTGKFSVIPKLQADGSVQLGYVEYYKGRSLGPIRESLVGGAPLLAGTAVILLIGYKVFGVTDLALAVQTGNIDMLALVVNKVINTNDFLVWLYLLFAVSNAMLPSPSDRRAWPAFVWIMALIAVVLYVLGFRQAFTNGLTQLAGPAAIVFGYLGMAFSMAIAVDLFFMAAIGLTESLLSRIFGVTVVYGRGSLAPTAQKNI